MRERTLAKSTAICAVILVTAALLILLIYPARVFKETYATDAGIESAGADVFASEPVAEEDTLAQRFTAQYDRLRSVDIFIDEMMLGRSIQMKVFDPKGQMIARRYYDLASETIPGMVRFPLGLDLEVGEEYILYLQGLYSTVRYGMVPEADASVYLGVASYHDTAVKHGRLAVSVVYELPLGKGRSVALMGAIALLALIAVTAVNRHFQKPLLPFLKGRRDSVDRLVLDPPVTIGRMMQVVLNPVLCVFFGTLFVLNWPLKRFDDRVTDIVFYALGILIAWGICLYLVNHKCVKGTGTLTHVFQMLCIAAMLWYATDYMNGISDFYHRVSERQITIAFLLLILSTFSWKELRHVTTAVLIPVLVLIAIGYVHMHAYPPEDKDFILGNQIVRLTGVCIVLTGITVFHVIRSLVASRAGWNLKKMTPFAWLTILTALFLVLFRNGRVWTLVLIGYYGLFFLRFPLWKDRANWNRILLGGILGNFLLTVAYCLLYRYYAAFLTSRFAMRFHTVTVTAEYLTVICGAAIVLFLGRRRKVYNTVGGLALTGLAAAYTVFTLSRTAYLAVIVTGAIVLLADATGFSEKKGRHFFSAALPALAAVLVVFPAAFTLQRILPVMAGHPVVYEIETTDALIRGGINWDHRNLMCVERFLGHFQSKILGQPEPGYDYPEDDYNYDENGEPLYDRYGNPLTVSDSGARRGRMEEADSVEQFSNGRMTIFKAYWDERNLTGHDTMGAHFADGTLIIHAHNVYLQVMFDFGLITGVVFALWLFAGATFAVIVFYKRKETDAYSLLPLATICGFMVVGLTEWNFHYANPMAIAMLLSMATLLHRTATRE